MAYIKHISYYLPEYILTNNKINEEFPEWGIDKISNKTGIKERHISAPDEFSSDMAVKAAEKLFTEHNFDRSSVDFILFCTQSPDYFLPTTACVLQNRLKLGTGIGALDFNLGCSGYVYGLSLCKGLIAAGLAKNILLITSETYSKFIHPKDKSNRTIFGDAAAATIVSKNIGICSINEFVFGTDGSGAENLMVKEGGLRFPLTELNLDISDEYGNVRNDKNLYMNGTEIFNFTGESVPKLTKEILSKAKLSPEDVDLYIFHQANRYMLNHLRKKIGIAEEKFFIAMEHCGNTVSSSIPIALYEAINNRELENKRNIVLAGFGVGYSWAACNLHIS